MYYTYVLQSEIDGNFYVGITNDLKQRFDNHQRGHVNSTRDRRPLKLIYYEACISQQDATKREKYLKTYHGRMFVKRRVESYLTGWIANWPARRFHQPGINNNAFIDGKALGLKLS